jgi:Tol biopolymer transport system component
MVRRLGLVSVVVLVVAVPAALGSFAGRNGRIVFVAARTDGAPGIVSIGVDGSRRRNLTHHSDAGPVVSPDRRQVAFTRNGIGQVYVYVMNANGSHQRVVARGLHPSWSPDEKRIAYEGSDGISVVDLATGATTAVAANGTSPVWSPDGAWIAFTRSGASLTDASLVVVHPDGTDERVLATPAAFPSWSPDGKKIVFAGGDPLYGRLQTVTLSGSLDTILVRDSIATTLWSPDGRWIAFQGSSGIEVVSVATQKTRVLASGELAAWSPDSTRLAVVDVRWKQLYVATLGGHVRRVTHEDPLSNMYLNVAGYPPVGWGANGRLYFEHTAGTDTKLLSANADGSQVRLLTTGYHDDRSPAWSPDGRRVAFSRNVRLSSQPNWEIFVVSANGRELHRLTTNAGSDDHPTWSPDGRRIAFVRGGTIVTVDPAGRHPRVVARGLETRALAWSPDGSRFVLAEADTSAMGDDDLIDSLVAVLPASGGTPRVVTDGAQPAWSPDGRWIVFVHTVPCGSDCDASTLRLVRPDGTGERTIPGSSQLFGPHFSPDGRLVVASSERGLVVLDPARGVVRRLRSAGSDPVWQPLPR